MSAKQFIKQIADYAHPHPVNPLTLPPWVSPNIWNVVIDTLKGVGCPRVFEYGTGCSTLWHVRAMVEGSGGRYCGVEHHLDWHATVGASLVEEYTRRRQLKSVQVTQLGADGADFLLLIAGDSGKLTEVTLRYRPSPTWKRGEGTAEEFSGYVRAPGDEQFDLVVVDGRARVACVDFVLAHSNVVPGGHLILCEAGRGMPNWLGQPTCTGPADYQPVVRRMLALGAVLHEGVGYGTWPGMDRTTRQGRGKWLVPAEICSLKVGARR